MPFEDELVLKLHYGKHRGEFTFADENEYQTAADQFMAGAPVPPIRECRRANGDRVRFNRTNGYLGIEAPTGFLKSFHRASDRYIALGYFKWECGRTDLD